MKMKVFKVFKKLTIAELLLLSALTVLIITAFAFDTPKTLIALAIFILGLILYKFCG